MSSILKHKINNEALKYTTAIAELKLLAHTPPNTSNIQQNLHKAIPIFKNNLKYIKARRLQIVHNNITLRKTLENKIKPMSSQERQLFIRRLRQEPRKVLDLFGAREALGVMSCESADLWSVMLAFAKLVIKENKEDQKLARGNASTSIAEKFADVEDKIKAIEQQKQEAEERFIKALVSAVIQMVTGIASNDGLPGAAAEEAPAPPETTTEIIDTSSYDDCMNKAAQKLESCKSNCPPGNVGESCRSLCYAKYLEDTARCLLGG